MLPTLGGGEDLFFPAIPTSKLVTNALEPTQPTGATQQPY